MSEQDEGSAGALSTLDGIRHTHLGHPWSAAGTGGNDPQERYQAPSSGIRGFRRFQAQIRENIEGFADGFVRVLTSRFEEGWG